MVSYRCPNCGRIYNYGNDGWYHCMNCRYPLKRAEEINSVKHPELNPMLNDNHVIGMTNRLDKSIPKCPICQSENLSKISTTKKIAKVAMFGIFGMGDNGKNWKCNNCGSKF